ncbi:MAG: nucleotidyltransferase family protein [Planctomycetota bacterium]
MRVRDVKFGRIELPGESIAEFCRKYEVKELAVFGSVLGEDFRTDSDVDVLVTFVEDCRHSLFDLAEMQQELTSLLGHEVDLVEKASVRNPFRRRSILNSMEVVYAA